MVEQPEGAMATRKVTLKALPLGEAITIGTLAERLGVDAVQVIKQLMRSGIFASVNQVVDFDTAAMVARVFGFAGRRVEEKIAGSRSSQGSGQLDNPVDSELTTRAPVVTILGHVDHGKTTLLDYVRKAHVVDTEAGGITQHIGAYQVDHSGSSITFIDTPGHAAFTAMRARGAQVTDIAILVVAANDGVMPQTAEAINHIKAAKVPIVVAINKMDSPEADPEKVRRQLSEHDLVVEKWGGDVLDVEVSAKTGQGIDDLLDSVLLVAEISELKANPSRLAVGVVIEAKLDRNRGPIATVLVQTGTLAVGNYIVVGSNRGRVKALVNDQGIRVDLAGPSSAVEILGLSGLPEAGDRLDVVEGEKIAKDMVDENQKIRALARSRTATLEEVGARISAGHTQELALVVKTDVHGSVEAARHALEELSTNETQVRIIHASTGSITESDVLLAVASNAIIIGFNVKPDQGAQQLAAQDSVQIREYNIIYRLTEDIERALAGMLAPTYSDVLEGRLEIRAIFPLGRTRKTAGCFVLEGKISRGSLGRVLRNGEQLFDGQIGSLRRFKDDVREVATGYECGVVLEGFSAFQEGDIIEAHRLQSDQ